MNYNDRSTLYKHLDFWYKYSVNEREMLFSRTCLLIEYENANRILDRAKPNKRQVVSFFRTFFSVCLSFASLPVVVVFVLFELPGKFF